MNRKKFLRNISILGAGMYALPVSKNNYATLLKKKMFFEISLAEWSLHKALFSKKMDNLDFPEKARKAFNIGTVEYVNTFFKDKAENTSYLNQLLQRCKDNDVKNHLIMCDGEGELGNTNEKERIKAVENHYKWVNAAKYLGCATIRVNAAGNGSMEDVAKAASEGLSRLGEYAAKENINVVVENHGGYSSNGKWLSKVISDVNARNVGTLPDLGNFCLKRDPDNWKNCLESYDRYIGTTELMPFAKGVSAKTYDFDDKGNCVETDYGKMLNIIKAQGFKGYIGIEYEGEQLPEEEGILKTKQLLENAAATLL